MSKTAFITGATGFTGGHLARRLVKDGWHVKALVRRSSAFKELKDLGCELVFGDIVERKSFEKNISREDIVFHIAAFYREESSDDMFYSVNVEGTRNILEVSSNVHVKRFIHCSTVGVHGEIASPPATETSPFNPGDIYQKTKLQGELLVRSYIDGEKISAVIFRPVGIYGPGDTRFLKLFKLVKAPLSLLVGSGETLYHLTYIDDLIDGVIACAEKDEALGKTFILAGERYTTVKELMRMIGAVMGKKPHFLSLPKVLMYLLADMNEYIAKHTGLNPVLYRRRLDFFTKDRAFSSDYARECIGFAPKTALEDGLAQTYAWYKHVGGVS